MSISNGYYMRRSEWYMWFVLFNCCDGRLAIPRAYQVSHNPIAQSSEHYVADCFSCPITNNSEGTRMPRANGRTCPVGPVGPVRTVRTVGIVEYGTVCQSTEGTQFSRHGSLLGYGVRTCCSVNQSINQAISRMYGWGDVVPHHIGQVSR